MIRHNRLLVAFHVVSDALLGLSAFIAAYALRFHTGIIPVPKGIPPLRQYINVLPFIAVVVPLGFFLQGLYRLRRGRSRVDDFFAVFVGSILAVLFGMMSTLYLETYIVTSARDTGALEVSQPVWVIFLVLNVGLTFASRELMREVLERRWRAGIGLKKILIAGCGDLGRLDPRTPRARLPDRRVRRRQGRRRPSGLPWIPAPRHTRRRCSDHRR
jgi:FlaA1/EpsC-like NDP-sugar epimerase